MQVFYFILLVRRALESVVSQPIQTVTEDASNWAIGPQRNVKYMLNCANDVTSLVLLPMLCAASVK